VNPRLRYTLGDHLHPNAEGCWVAAQILKQELDVLRAEDAPLPAPSADDAAAAAARRLGLDEPHPWRITVNLGNTLLQQGRYGAFLARLPMTQGLKMGWALVFKPRTRSWGRTGEVLRQYVEEQKRVAHAKA